MDFYELGVDYIYNMYCPQIKLHKFFVYETNYNMFSCSMTWWELQSLMNAYFNPVNEISRYESLFHKGSGLSFVDG